MIALLLILLLLKCQERDITEKDDIRDDNHMVAKYCQHFRFFNALMGTVLFRHRCCKVKADRMVSDLFASL
uniref:Secreted protein n=1 Tax=Elaeophora elaphi TaxID=1147741 RepID=A0A0R3S785_9BILA